MTTTQTLTLAELLVAATETKEARPELRPKASNELSPLGYWKAVDDISPHGLSWAPRVDYCRDVGAIMGLLDGPGIRYTLSRQSDNEYWCVVYADGHGFDAIQATKEHAIAAAYLLWKTGKEYDIKASGKETV